MKNRGEAKTGRKGVGRLGETSCALPGVVRPPRKTRHVLRDMGFGAGISLRRRRRSLFSTRRRSSCSQMRITVQPFARHCCPLLRAHVFVPGSRAPFVAKPRQKVQFTRRSRARLVSIFFRQKAALVLGWVACLGQPWLFRADGDKTGWRSQTGTAAAHKHRGLALGLRFRQLFRSV
jgi:hypothetical protein